MYSLENLSKKTVIAKYEYLITVQSQIESNLTEAINHLMHGSPTSALRYLLEIAEELEIEIISEF